MFFDSPLPEAIRTQINKHASNSSSSRAIRTSKVHTRSGLDPGHRYGAPGEGFMRINLACCRQLVDKALARLASALPN
jgi:bifunctional pyridoxal-dependent enzyme with beta-cystathionase and maltose regulon repressor activities